MLMKSRNYTKILTGKSQNKKDHLHRYIRIEQEFYTYTSTVQVLFSMKFQNNFKSFCSSKIRIFYSRSTNLQGEVHMKRAFVFKLVLYNLYSLYAGINNLSLHILGIASIEEINIQVKIKQY